MRLAVATAALSLLALAGCNSKDSVEAKNESVESVAKKVADSDIKPRPGRWESSLKLESMDMPGLTPQMKETMSKAMATTKTFASCLTAAEAEKPDASFFQPGETGCTYEHFTMAGGKLDAAMKCSRPGGVQSMTMQGTYSPDSYNMRVSSKGEMTPGKAMSMTMSINSRRTGECTGQENK